MVTDTGRFRFDSVNGDTMRTAGALLDLGVDICYIDNNLSVETINTLKLKGYVLSNFCYNRKMVLSILKITRDVVEKYNVTDEEAANQVSTIGTIDGYPVWALFIEYPNEIRIRLRSRGPEIDKLANKYGGGGHAKASGAKAYFLGTIK
ncbi:MAG: DHHA1 domain-containing protein [Clostridium sp.]|nr:MAG: DHHA1 domain-containing protein [Clostridium sp.]